MTRARTVEHFTNDSETIAVISLELLRAYAPVRPVRLLGVRVASFEDESPAPSPQSPVQLVLPV